ncbi:uncharacterized protein E0L32_010648 [Thyridium curvatum]|uniref:Uncharacterized protein n=1 Tax=Thyridium curvatum TaxID=1093900 RepID=A0A507ATW3_9PEZI|nr:uncharacterized protein E0L32_010648 [Thyridium curvatum]TPX07650.1 hypothetical protein E0L32_010648 [Thyridium curvatum]
MATKQEVSTSKAPAPLPQFSQAIKHNGMVYCSGNVGLSPETRKLAEGGATAEARQAIANLKAILEEAGSSLANIVKMNIFITTMDDFGAINKAYDEFFDSISPKPCRTCVAVYQLPLGAKVEIECTAFM